MEDLRGEIGELEERIERLSDSLDRCRKVALAARIAIAAGAVLLAALLFGPITMDVLWLMVATTLLLGGIVLAGSNARTAAEYAAGIAEAERLRAELIGAIDLRLVPDAPEPSRLLH
jgi:small neutral amino acid transporter SnatA (MarC family)